MRDPRSLFSVSLLCLSYVCEPPVLRLVPLCTAVPQGLAYATLVGLPPVYGLYCAFTPPLVYFVFGSSRHLVIGPTSILALLIGSELEQGNGLSPEEFVQKIFVVTLVSGILNTVIGLLRLGFITSFIGRPVTSGFTCGAAVLVSLSQMPSLLGVSLPGGSSDGYALMQNIVKALPKTNLWSTLIGVFSIIFIMIVRLFSRLKLLPTALVVVVVGTVLAWSLQLPGFGVPVVGPIQPGLPPLTNVSLGSFQSILQVLPRAVLIAVIDFMESYSIAKVFAAQKKYDLNANQEVFAIGMANLICAFFSSFPPGGSLARTAVNARVGGTSSISPLVGICLERFTPRRLAFCPRHGLCHRQSSISTVV